jgi:hypothetical protein
MKKVVKVHVDPESSGAPETSYKSFRHGSQPRRYYQPYFAASVHSKSHLIMTIDMVELQQHSLCRHSEGLDSAITSITPCIVGKSVLLYMNATVNWFVQQLLPPFFQ